MVRSLKEQLSSLGARSNHNPVPTPPGFEDVAETTGAPEITTAAPTDVAPVSEATEALMKEIAASAKAEAVLREASVAEEATKTETAKQDTAPENTVSKAATETNTVKSVSADTEKKISISEMRLRNASDFNPASVRVMSAKNSGLKQFIANTFGKKDSENIVMEYTIDGTFVRGTNQVAVWEEGGASYGDGYALLIADKDGNKKQAVIAYHDLDMVNGKHALVPVEKGDLITMGATNGSDWFVVLCVIESFVGSPVKNKIDINVSVIGCVDHEDDKNNPDEEILTYQSAYPEDHEYTKKYTVNLPLLSATHDRVFDLFCHEPKWIKDYTAYKWSDKFRADMNRCVTDKRFIKSMQIFDTTNDAYEALEKDIGSYVTKCGKEDNVFVTIIHNIGVDNAGKECIYIFIMCTTFNTKNYSSSGNRHFYARVKLEQGQTFTYIDRKDEFWTYEDIYNRMNEIGEKWIGSSDKRMTV